MTTPPTFDTAEALLRQRAAAAETRRAREANPSPSGLEVTGR